MSQKQTNLLSLCERLGIDILNIEDYNNKDSILKCKCKQGHELIGSVDSLIKTGFECIECLSLEALNVQDTVPFFLSLDAASYITGLSIFNKQGQLLSHRTISIDKKKLFFPRVQEIVEQIEKIIQDNNIKCVILEDIQYQQNPVLFKKLAMLHGVLRYTIIQKLDLPLITAMADEWRSYNHISGTKRPDQKKAAIKRAFDIFKQEIPEDESESIFLGYYGIYLYNTQHIEED